jgi:hypothetical protein
MRRNAPGRDRIAVTESSGESDHIETINDVGIGHQPVEMHMFRTRAGQFKRVPEFKVAVDPGGGDDDGAWHDELIDYRSSPHV